MFKQFNKKLTLFFSIVLSCVLMVINLIIYFIFEETIMNHELSQLISFSKTLKKQRGTSKESDLQLFQSLSSSLELNQFSFLTDAQHNILHSSPNGVSIASLFPNQVLHQVQQGKHYVYQKNKRTYMLIRFPWQKNSKVELNIFAGQDITSTQHLINQLKTGLIIFSFFLILFAILVGNFFSHKAMIPIKQSYHQQQEFVANASHELRTSLAILYSSTEVLEECRYNLSPLHQQMLSNVQEEMERLNQMVENLLILARSDAKTLAVEQRRIHLNQMISNVLTYFQTIAYKQKIQLKNHITDDHDFFYYGHPDLIKQLLIILIDNAIKYNKQGGTVDIRLVQHGNKVTINIQDTGIGIHKKDLAHIFKRFYRSDQARSCEKDGSGLGLSIVSAIVEACEGKIKVSSQVGIGTLVTVQLPLRKQDLTLGNISSC